MPVLHDKLIRANRDNESMLPTTTLASSVLVILLEDVEWFEEMLKGGYKRMPNRLRKTHQQNHKNNRENNGIDALFCLFKGTEMIEYWCECAEVSITLIQEYVREKYPLSVSEYNEEYFAYTTTNKSVNPYAGGECCVE